MRQHIEAALAVTCGVSRVRTVQPACWISIHIPCVGKCANSRLIGASFALDGPRKRRKSILTCFEQRDRMPENALEALDIRCLASGLGKIIAQLNSAVSIGFNHFDHQ